jgi:hypothetical protein
MNRWDANKVGPSEFAGDGRPLRTPLQAFYAAAGMSGDATPSADSINEGLANPPGQEANE